MKIKLFGFFGLIFLLSCNTGSDESANEIMGVQSILWTQYSAEVEALFLQAYNIASDIVSQSDPAGYIKHPAVTLDLDETVLDNSPFSVYMIREGFDYSEEKWAEWCERREATPLPGALEFTKLADSIGVEVFYVSNRAKSLLVATLDNLNKYGFPKADSMHVILKENTSSKDERRKRIREDYEIIALIGDNLGDFDGIFDDRSIEFGKATVRKMEKEFGTRFIILPNPMYGSWERGIFPNGMPGEREVLEKLRSYE